MAETALYLNSREKGLFRHRIKLYSDKYMLNSPDAEMLRRYVFKLLDDM